MVSSTPLSTSWRRNFFVTFAKWIIRFIYGVGATLSRFHAPEIVKVFLKGGVHLSAVTATDCGLFLLMIAISCTYSTQMDTPYKLSQPFGTGDGTGGDCVVFGPDAAMGNLWVSRIAFLTTPNLWTSFNRNRSVPPPEIPSPLGERARERQKKGWWLNGYRRCDYSFPCTAWEQEGNDLLTPAPPG